MPAATENGRAVEKRVDSAAAGFIPTKEYHRFAEFCEACRRERYIGPCYGPAGVGKSLSARRYSKWHLFEDYVPYRASEGGASAESADCRAVLYTPPVTNTPRSVAEGVREARIAPTTSAASMKKKSGTKTDSLPPSLTAASSSWLMRQTDSRRRG